MGIYVNIGNAGFSTIRKNLYVDKTGLLSLMNRRLGTDEKLVCVSRPRRFGKSYAAQMLCAYYDSSCDSHELFDDLEIAKDESYEENLNKYNVIYLDITNIMEKAGASKTVSFIKHAISEELAVIYPKTTSANVLDEALIYAVEASGKQFVMLIDEWDALIREAPHMLDEYLKFFAHAF